MIAPSRQYPSNEQLRSGFFIGTNPIYTIMYPRSDTKKRNNSLLPVCKAQLNAYFRYHSPLRKRKSRQGKIIYIYLSIAHSSEYDKGVNHILVPVTLLNRSYICNRWNSEQSAAWEPDPLRVSGPMSSHVLKRENWQ